MKVVLRAFVESDHAPLEALFAEPDVQVWNPVGAGLHVPTWCLTNNLGASGREFRTWAIADPDDDRPLGTVSVFGLGPVPGQAGPEAEIGYRVRAAEAGRGVATAAVRAALARAVDELGPTTVRLFHAVENAASCRVAAKAGFALEGELCGLVPYGDGERHLEHLHRLVVDRPGGSAVG